MIVIADNFKASANWISMEMTTTFELHVINIWYTNWIFSTDYRATPPTAITVLASLISRQSLSEYTHTLYVSPQILTFENFADKLEIRFKHSAVATVKNGWCNFLWCAKLAIKHTQILNK